MKHLLIYTFLLLMVIIFADAAKDLDKTMILYLSFDELDGKKVEDHSTHKNHGEISGKPKLVDGKFAPVDKFHLVFCGMCMRSR